MTPKDAIRYFESYLESTKEDGIGIPSEEPFLLAIEALKEKQHNDELRKNGRLVELPCAIGDKAYWISDEDKDGNPILCIRKTPPIKGVAVESGGFYIRTDEENHFYEKVGERWSYLTQEAAQAALDEMREK